MTKWLVFHSKLIVMGQQIEHNRKTSQIYLQLIASHCHHPQPTKEILYIVQDYLWNQLSSSAQQESSWMQWWNSRQSLPPGRSHEMIENLQRISPMAYRIVSLYQAQSSQVELCNS